MKEYDSPTIKKIIDRMKHDPWYVKLYRWWNVDMWFIRRDIEYWIKNLLKKGR